jgi:hypothetical protein
MGCGGTRCDRRGIAATEFAQYDDRGLADLRSGAMMCSLGACRQGGGSKLVLGRCRNPGALAASGPGCDRCRIT